MMANLTYLARKKAALKATEFRGHRMAETILADRTGQRMLVLTCIRCYKRAFVPMSHPDYMQGHLPHWWGRACIEECV